MMLTTVMIMLGLLWFLTRMDLGRLDRRHRGHKYLDGIVGVGEIGKGFSWYPGWRETDLDSEVVAGKGPARG